MTITTLTKNTRQALTRAFEYLVEHPDSEVAQIARSALQHTIEVLESIQEDALMAQAFDMGYRVGFEDGRAHERSLQGGDE